MRQKLFKGLATFALVAACSANAFAENVVAEVEPNNTTATAQLLTPDPTDGRVRVANANRETSPTNDFNDFFRFQANAGNVISIRVLPGNSIAFPGTFGDSILRLLGPTGLTLVENDDCATPTGTNTFQSCILNFSITTSGTYFATVRGFGNDVFNYDLLISGLPQQVTPPGAIPEPATMILLSTGLAGIAAKVRRRRKEQE